MPNSNSEEQEFFFDPEKRAKEKQDSRDSDEADLKSGKKTVEQLKEENCKFSFPDCKIKWKKVKFK